MRAEFAWRNYRYFPYERTLAYKELRALAKRRPYRKQDGLIVELPSDWREIASRTTYFSRVTAETGESLVPNQTLLELASYQQRNAVSGPEKSVVARQSTRYSAHGLHEYKGKFNPQIVHVIGNMLALGRGDWVLDPFCGCGTTLLESAHNGWNAVGIDLNPLGVLITRAKIESMKVELPVLNEALRDLGYALAKGSEYVRNAGKLHHQVADGTGYSVLGEESMHYLSNWFPQDILDQLFQILRAIDQLDSAQARIIFRVVLSDMFREVSLQDPSDLRIRRRKSPIGIADVAVAYLETLKRRVRNIGAARAVVKDAESFQEAILGDSRASSILVASDPSLPSGLKFKAAITSPPYATALPYIDTQRLSLILLGLTKPSELSLTEKSLVGSREISDRERAQLERELAENPADLPPLCINLCRELLISLDNRTDGFRRRNVPALVYKYFCDMSLVLAQVRKLIHEDGAFALVVGRNRTRLGGRDLVIDTPHMLLALAKKLGYRTAMFQELDTYQRFDLHRSNSITSEALLILRPSSK
jgi:SAM-dependent methyltransferase